MSTTHPARARASIPAQGSLRGSPRPSGPGRCRRASGSPAGPSRSGARRPRGRRRTARRAARRDRGCGGPAPRARGAGPGSRRQGRAPPRRRRSPPPAPPAPPDGTPGATEGARRARRAAPPPRRRRAVPRLRRGGERHVEQLPDVQAEAHRQDRRPYLRTAMAGIPCRQRDSERRRRHTGHQQARRAVKACAGVRRRGRGAGAGREGPQKGRERGHRSADHHRPSPAQWWSSCRPRERRPAARAGTARRACRRCRRRTGLRPPPARRARGSRCWGR